MLRRLMALCLLLLLAGAPAGLAAPPSPAAEEFLLGYKPGTSEAQRIALIEAAGGRLVRSLPALSADLVALPAARLAGTDPAEASPQATLAAAAAIRYVEPNHRYSTHAAFTPSDTLLAQQYAWGRIKAFEGWAVTRGSADIVIAVIDSGVQLDHPDLAGKLVAGYDFVEDDAAPNDAVGHGTHVAGTAAAATDNGIGGAGMCPACRLMPIRAINATGTGLLADIALAIVYAADNGARVINLSLGGPDSAALRDAVAYAWAKGAFLTCSAGNAGTSSFSQAYPAAYPACFAVASTTGADVKSGFSNFGPWVDVAAPGDQILSTYLDDTYAVRSGTSMAAPHVAGLAGLLASQGYSNSAIRDRICATADPIAGTGTSWTCGRINVGRALAAAAPQRLTYLPLVVR